MTAFLVVCLVFGVIACLLTGVMSFDLYRSDAAGNGLTQAFLAIGLAVTWLLTAVVVITVALRVPHADCPAELPWTALSWAAVLLLAVGASGQSLGLSELFRSQRGPFTSWLQLCVPLVPLSFLLHAAWRTGLPLPWQVATWGCAVVVLAGSALPVMAKVQRHRRGPSAGKPVHAVVYPALLVQEREFVRVLRDALQLQRLPAGLLPRVGQPFVVDANCHRHELRDVHASGGPMTDGLVPVAFAIERSPEPMTFAAVQDLVTGIERLHEDPGQDREVRRLVAMQSSVTALTFVLPR